MTADEVSLVATVKDEAASIDTFLAGLLGQSRPPDEIVLVDGGSTDGTIAAIEGMRERAAIPIRLIEAPGTSISKGRNLAIENASHETIAVADAGTTPAPDWLEKLVAPLEQDPALAVASGFFLPGGSGWRQRTLAIVITPQREEIDPERFLPSSRSVAFRREWWRRVGGYPEWLRHSEDLVFDLALRRADARFAFVPEAIVVWSARPDKRSFARQYFNYARGDGHADLWPKRHALRYAAYAVGAFALRRGGWLRRLVFVAWLGYQWKYLRRLLRIQPSRRRSERLLAYSLVPLIVTIGDVAKMVGYAVGSYERSARSKISRADGSRP